MKIVELNSPLKSPFVGTAVASDTSLQCVRTHCSSLARQGKKATPLNAHVCERSRVPMSDTQHPWELREQKDIRVRNADPGLPSHSSPALLDTHFH